MKGNFRVFVNMLAIIVLLICGCSEKDHADPGDQKDFSPSVLEKNPMMQNFARNHPGLAILKYAQVDLDNNGKEDLIVIYRVAEEKNQMCVVLNRGLDFVETNSLPAPVSDQMIRFRDIDKKPPMEFVVQGRKGIKVGYAIFRIEKGKLVDVFGEGMQDCC